MDVVETTMYSALCALTSFKGAYLDRRSAKFQKMLRNHFVGGGGGGDQMLMKDTTAHSVQLSMPVNFQGGDN